MRIGIVSDIHGNIHALRSVESSLRELNVDEVTLESHFQDDLVLDSLGAMTLAVLIQENFSIDVSQYLEEYLSVQTVGELLNFLKNNSQEMKV